MIVITPFVARNCCTTKACAFFDSKGRIHKEFLPEGTTLNAAAYDDIRIVYCKGSVAYALSTPRKVPEHFSTIMAGHTQPLW